MAVIFLGPVLYLFLDVSVEGQLRVDRVWEVDLDSLEAYLLCVIGKGPTWHLSERARSKKVGSLLTREESRYVKGEGALRGREETYSPRIPRELRSLTPACAHHRRKFSERARQNHQQHPSFWFPSGFPSPANTENHRELIKWHTCGPLASLIWFVLCDTL